MSGVCVCVCVCWLSRAIPWLVTCQAPLSMGFSRQGYWSGLLFPTPGDLLDSGRPASLAFPALAIGFFTTAPPGHTQFYLLSLRICHFSVPPVYRSIQYVSFCVWCISLVLMFVGALEHDFYLRMKGRVCLLCVVPCALQLKSIASVILPVTCRRQYIRCHITDTCMEFEVVTFLRAQTMVVPWFEPSFVRLQSLLMLCLPLGSPP